MQAARILVLDRSDDLAHQVREVASELRPQPVVVVCERIASVSEVFEREGPFQVVLAGSSLATVSGLSRLHAMHNELPALSLILAFSNRPDANLRDIVRTGALDILQLPVSHDALRAAIEQAIEVSRQRTAATSAGAAGPAGGDREDAGSIFTVASATGGCGKTFYASNLAYFLHTRTGERTCLVDLDLQFGELHTSLRLRSKYTLVDALKRRDADDEDLRASIDEYLTVHDTGIHVLPAPKDPSEADEVESPDVARVLEALRARFAYVVVDTPPVLTETVLAALDLSGEVHVLANLDLPSIRNLGAYLKTLARLKMDSENVRLVLNKVERDTGIDVAQAEQLFAQGFTTVLPYDKEVTRSINIGTPMLAFAPNAEVSRALASGLERLLGDTEVAAPAGANGQTQGTLSRLLRRSPRLRPTSS